MDEELKISPYATIYKQDTPTSRTIVSSGGETTGTVSGVREANRRAYEKEELDDAARRFVKDNNNMVSFEKARTMMEKRLDNMRKQAEFKVDQETRELDAHNTAIDVVNNLYQIPTNDENASSRVQELRKRLGPIAGTSAGKEALSQINNFESTSLKEAREARLAKAAAEREQQALKQSTPEYRASVAGAEEKARLTEKRASEEAEQWKKEQDPMYQAKLQAEKTRTKVANKQYISALESQKKDLLSRYSTSELDLTSGFESNEKGSKADEGKGTHFTFNTFENKKRGKKTVSKDEFNQIKSRLSEINKGIDSLNIETAEPQSTSEAPTPSASKPLTKEILSSLADELGPNATRESLMDLAKKRGYSF